MTDLWAGVPPSMRRLGNVCLGFILVGVTIGILIPAGPGWDFANFYDTGLRVLHGQLADIYDPTTLIAGQRPQGKMAFWGTPVSAAFYAPLGLLSPYPAMVAFKILGTAALSAGLFLLYRHCRELWEECGYTGTPLLVVFLALILIYQPFWTMYRVGGQTTPFVFLLFVLALGAFRRGAMAVAAGLLLIAALIKPGFVLMPGLLALITRGRFLAATVALFGTIALASVLLLGWPIHREFLDVALAGARMSSPWTFNSSLSILADVVVPIFGMTHSGRLELGIRMALKLFVVAVGVLLLLRGVRSPITIPTRRHLGFLLALSVVLLVSQVVWEHYLALLFIPLIYLTAIARALPRGARRLLAAIFLLAIGQNLILVLFLRDHLPLQTPAGLLLVSLMKSGPLLLYLVLLGTYHRDVLAAFITHPVPETDPPRPIRDRSVSGQA